MTRPESDLAPRTHDSETTINTSDSTPLPGQGNEPELNAINGGSISNIRTEARRKCFHEIFEQQKWHKPYADALMEGDSSKIPAAVANAERAIFNRYLELWASKDQSDERVDLWLAVEALRELEDATKNESSFPPTLPP